MKNFANGNPSLPNKGQHITGKQAAILEPLLILNFQQTIATNPIHSPVARM
jgi:hypothetical protein